MKKNRKNKPAPPPGLPPEQEQIIEVQPKKQPFLKRLLFGEDDAATVEDTAEPAEAAEEAPAEDKAE